ncbi:MAG TPA: exodeoxyribonuclease V subunit gamma [Polyangiaceae bacterium]
MIILHRNNRMELLLAELGDVLLEPRLNVFQPEVIVVQSLGMERWLSMGLASRFGVWANAQHPFPRAFIESISDLLVGKLEEHGHYTREAMTYHLAQILSDLPSAPALSSLRQYLSVRSGVVPRLELAEQLADAFDQVQIYRPDWMNAWAESTIGVESDFRPALFKLLMARLGDEHVPRRIARLVQALKAGALPSAALPERICLFGVASLPPSFIQVFDALARHVPVHWFLLTASREYVGEERGKREIVRQTKLKPSDERASSRGSEAETLEQAFLTEQPLLANFGRILRDLGLLLERDCEYVEASGHPFVEPEPTSVLTTLQADLCALRRRGAAPDTPKLTLDTDDRSLEIHACHGPRRELEVLRDRLLAAFECDASLRPEDVIVLLRDVEIYAPLVEAVFAGERGRPGTLPYVLSDRTIGAANPLAETLVELLEFGRTRVTVKALTLLIGQPAIAKCFEFSDEEQSRIRSWLRELHVTWGMDLDDRLSEGFTGQKESTIRQGISRLVLGAAVDTSVEMPWQGLLPVDVEGDDAELAGRFVECVETLFKWRARFTETRPFGEWASVLADACRETFAIDASDAWQLSDLLQTVRTFCSQAESTGFSEAVPAQVIAARITAHYTGNRSAQSILTGGVTFCAMLPMRGIPARIVAMVGLDDGCFPRVVSTSSFDDVARSPARPGDRSGRDEDRHLFLETLLAARERLIITYRGRHPSDDSTLPRSVVVEELLGTLDESYALLADGSLPSEWLVVVHPLHAHSRRYFDGSDPRLVGLTWREYRAAVALEGAAPGTESGMLVGLSAPSKATVHLDQLEQFWSMPAQYFHHHCLGAQLLHKRDVPNALDPTELDPLSRYQLSLEQMQALAQGAGLESGLVRWTAKGLRPFSNWGRLLYDEQWQQTLRFFSILKALGFEQSAQIVDLRIDLATTQLQANIHDRFNRGRIDWSPSRLSAKHRVVAWLRHLAMAAGGVPSETWLLRRGPTADKPLALEHLKAIEPVAAQLELEKLWQFTLLGHRAPLAFFPDLAWDYVYRLAQGESEAEALERAHLSYGDPLNDGDDDYRRPMAPREVLRLFGTEPPLTAAWPTRFEIAGFPAFAELARAFFEPYLEYARVVQPESLIDAPTSAGEP